MTKQREFSKLQLSGLNSKDNLHLLIQGKGQLFSTRKLCRYPLTVTQSTTYMIS
jgi:hypothetical protein